VVCPAYLRSGTLEATADAYATAAYAMGPDFGPPWTARLRGYEAMTILANGTVLSTGGFPAT
jgi:thiamine biosynthesis lipoprotein